MKKNFTDSEIAILKSTLGSKLNVSINRAGNIKVINPNEPENHSYWGSPARGFWVLYHNNVGYLWRRHDGHGYCYPLNMRGRKNDLSCKPFVWTDDNGHTHKEYYRPYNINKSYFNSVNEALEYFVNYLKKHRNINL